MDVSLTLQQDHAAELKRLLSQDNGHEAAAYLLCGQALVERDPWSGNAALQVLSHAVEPVPPEDLFSASPAHVTWTTGSFVRILKQAQAHSLVAGIVHSHPDGPTGFSSQDDANERELLILAQNRNGPDTRLLSLIFTPNGLVGRLWTAPDQHVPLHIIKTIGAGISLDYDRHTGNEELEVWHRQALAFGGALNYDLQQLQIGIVGCGATGSATAMLLARLGVGSIVLIDKDVVEVTNLNRLHGATMKDALAQTPKVEAVKRSLDDIGLNVRVAALRDWVGSAQCRDALKSCDVIFGCTDDHSGRLLLNRFAYFYLVPVIDMGLAIDVSDGQPPKISDLSGRVTFLAPGYPCLLCRNEVNPERAQAEALQRTNPDEYQRLKEDAYVLGEGNPSPAVVTFTTEVASMAVSELLHRLHGFRNLDFDTSQWRRFFHRMKDRPQGPHRREICSVCVDMDNWGLGDTDPFLDMVG